MEIGGSDMIIFTIIISAAILLGALVMYASCSYAEHKGYMRGLDEAEEIVKEVRHESDNVQESAEGL